MIRKYFGTARGAARLALSFGQVASGQAFIRRPADMAQVQRLVFVCQGNICRSAYAEVVARVAGMKAASFGLSTTTGKGAHPPAIAAARECGVDLSAHRTRRVEDYVPQPGDLLLAMEVRQLARLAAEPRLENVERSLLGLWAAPMRPHMHDPFGMDEAYMRTCLAAIDGAVKSIAAKTPCARIC